MTERDYDVVVVGGGLVGIAVAYGLARRNIATAVIDEGDGGFRAARGNFALIWVSSKGGNVPAYHLWSRSSGTGFPDFAAELADRTGIDIGLQQPGGLVLALSEGELQRRIGIFKKMAQRPEFSSFPFDVLDRAETLKMMPEAGPEVVGAVYSPLDGHVNSLRMFHALHRGFRSLDGAYLHGAGVQSIAATGGCFRVETASGSVAGGKLVLAAGIDNARLGPMVGLKAPVRPQRGQIIVTERAAPFLPYPTVTVRQTDDGGVMIGDSKEEAGLATEVGVGILSVEADRAMRMFPRLGRLNVVRTWSALRVMTPDAVPIYDESTEYPGAFLCTCHSGVTLAAAHALEFSAMVAAGALEARMAPFSARRFDVPSAG